MTKLCVKIAQTLDPLNVNTKAVIRNNDYALYHIIRPTYDRIQGKRLAISCDVSVKRGEYLGLKLSSSRV